MSFQAGQQLKLQVKREAPFGYFLSDGKEEVLLHKNELTEDVSLEQMIDVFLYSDHQGRLAATMATPIITVGTYDWVKVVDVHHKYGVFVSIGIAKDLLVSRDDLPYSYEEWPKPGDTLYCTLKVDKKGRLFAEMATFEVIEDLSKRATEADFNKDIEGTIYKLVEEGAHIYTDEGFIGFNHESERRGVLRLGERVSGRIIAVKEDGRVNLSLLKRSHEALDEDAEAILSYLEGRGGGMPYWDKTPADLIEARFNLSKSAFKRALGRLMKQGKVYQEEGWTYTMDKKDKQ
ncbi:S1-like domain-containing RNA-binding protein [Pullulanibacillus sp. KACC 23026]|uniref:CvfB family protein n=1 Tax=Pullulanibacillus sp. KACC 23026 TaxID=3028315 RepID=UPI0023AF9BB9|nr:S1-like domain-containing RNA-binding protein [Pullulanibacillus sp. KACC 23026]WEG14374.1 S1-like domain-containing RNA-binding protein [Pullulanibacillus sp. KACC 23026]